MTWPIGTDYQEAVQNPTTAFSNDELRKSRPQLNKLGLPRPITGAFACVYEFRSPSRRLAVRCFLREFADQQRRYEAISEHLRKHHLNCCVDFEFIKKGVNVKGKWYPILTMEWIDGIPLDRYVHSLLDKPTELQSLAQKWRLTLTTLKHAGIAHGDLQHGNVLVRNGELKLIDYDGMFVPALKGNTSHEEGHRNYQHPQRSGRDFDIWIDNFPAWLVSHSLTALSINPRLWKQVDGGDECLIFRREDFTNPRASKVFSELERSSNQTLRQISSELKGWLNGSPQQAPAIDSHSTVSTHPTPRTLAKDWLPHHTTEVSSAASVNEPNTDSPLREEPANRELPDWVRESTTTLIPSQPYLESLRAQIKYERLGLMCAAIASITSLVLALLSPIDYAFLSLNASFRISLALLVSAVLLLVLKYTAVKKNVTLFKRIEAEKQTEARRSLIEIEAHLTQLRQRASQHTNRREAIKLKLHKTQQLYEEQLSLLDRQYKASLYGLDHSIDSINSSMVASLDQVNRRFQQYRFDLQSQIDKCDAEKMRTIKHCLDTQRDLHNLHVLSTQLISDVSLYGIGSTKSLIDRLRSEGYVTAADVTANIAKVAGIGQKRLTALLEWRERIEKHASHSAPQRLPQAELDTIERECARSKEVLYEQLKRIKRDEICKCDQVRIRSENKVSEKNSQKQQLHLKLQNEKQNAANAAKRRELEIHAELSAVKDWEQNNMPAIMQLQRRIGRYENERIIRYRNVKQSELDLKRYDGVTFLRFIALYR